MARDILVGEASFTSSQQAHFTLHENVPFGSEADPDINQICRTFIH